MDVGMGNASGHGWDVRNGRETRPSSLALQRKVLRDVASSASEIALLLLCQACTHFICPRALSSITISSHKLVSCSPSFAACLQREDAFAYVRHGKEEPALMFNVCVYYIHRYHLCLQFSGFRQRTNHVCLVSTKTERDWCVIHIAHKTCLGFPAPELAEKDSCCPIVHVCMYNPATPTPYTARPV